MDTTTTVQLITTDILEFAPAVIAGVTAAETTGAPGADKQTRVLNGVLAGSDVLATDTAHPLVAGIAMLINLIASILYPHKAT